MKTITREQVTELISRLGWCGETEFDFEIARKDDSDFMKTIAGALDLMGIIDHADFMERYTTTIGRTIYAPFTFGDSDDQWRRWSHVRVLVHELTHVAQYDADPILFPARYLSDRSWRAQYEAEAFTADLQFHHWLTGEIYDLEAQSMTLLNYGLSQKHCGYVEQHLASIAETIKEGGRVSPIATVVIEIIEDDL